MGVTGADDFAFSTLPNDPKGNGTAGERGGMVITNAPDVVAYTMRLINFDFQPGTTQTWCAGPGPGFGPPGTTPTPLPDMCCYIPVKATPLVVTETESFEMIQSPDNELRDVDSLIRLVNPCGAG